MAINPEDIINPIRYYKPNDPYYYEVDNLPLEDLLENDRRLLQSLTNLLVWWPDESVGTFSTQAQVNLRVLGDLADVDNSVAVTDQILAHTGASWKPTSLGEGGLENLGKSVNFEYRMKDKMFDHDVNSTKWLAYDEKYPYSIFDVVFWRCQGRNDDYEWGTFGNKFVVPLDRNKNFTAGDFTDPFSEEDYSDTGGFLSHFGTGDTFNFNFSDDCLVVLAINGAMTPGSSYWANHPSLGYGDGRYEDWNTNLGHFTAEKSDGSIKETAYHYEAMNWVFEINQTSSSMFRNVARWQYCHFFSLVDALNGPSSKSGIAKEGAGLWTQIEFSIKVKGDQDTEYSTIPILNIYQDNPDGLTETANQFGNGNPETVHTVSGVNPIKLSTLIDDAGAIDLRSDLPYRTDVDPGTIMDPAYGNFANLKGLSVPCNMPSEFQNAASTSWVDAYLQVTCAFHHHPNTYGTVDVSDEGVCGLGALFDSQTRGNRAELNRNQQAPYASNHHNGDSTRGFNFSISRGIKRSGLNSPILATKFGKFDASSY
jgi:hypothetical protein